MMHRFLRSIRFLLAAALIAHGMAACGGNARAAQGEPPADRDRVQTHDGSWHTGRFVADSGRARFETRSDPTQVFSWAEIRRVEFGRMDDRASEPEASPFLIELTDGGQVSASRLHLKPAALDVDPADRARAWEVPRPWVRRVAQRPGESLLLSEEADPFLGPAWERTGTVRAGGPDANTVQLGAPASLLRHRLADPLWSGRIEVVYDDSRRLAGQRFWLELGFQLPGRENGTVRIIPGGDAASAPSVESPPGGPSLAVQRLLTDPGRHRLVVVVGSDRTRISLDGADLAHGESVGAPVLDMAVVCQGGGQPGSRGGGVVVEAIRIVRRLEPTARPVIDVSLDSALRVDGDQLFGEIQAIDSQSIGLATTLGGRPIVLPWKDVCSVEFRRRPTAQVELGGLWARIAWTGSSSAGEWALDQVEAVLLLADPKTVRFHSPALGVIELPRSRVRSIEPTGSGARLIVLASPIHLGDRPDPDLDPPDPDGSEVVIPFGLSSVPSVDAELLIDVLGVVGVDGTPIHSELVRDGQLRTHLEIGGTQLADLNDAIHAPNTERTRVRIPIPKGVLKRENALRITQQGTTDDPAKRDNLSMLGIAIEWPADEPQQPVRSEP